MANLNVPGSVKDGVVQQFSRVPEKAFHGTCWRYIDAEAAEAETWETCAGMALGGEGDSEVGRALATPGLYARLGNSIESSP